MTNLMNFQDEVSFIWSIAELLRGPFKKEDYSNIFFLHIYNCYKIVK